MAILAFLIRWRRVALPLALLVALGISMGVSYYKGYRACTVKFKAQAQERTINDYEKLDKERAIPRNVGTTTRRMLAGTF